MKKESEKIIVPGPQLDETSMFLPYMKIIEEAIRNNKVSVDELIRTLSYTHFMMLAYDMKTELADALTFPSTKYKVVIKKFLKTFDTMTKEEFTRRKAELRGIEYEKPKLTIQKAPQHKNEFCETIESAVSDVFDRAIYVKDKVVDFAKNPLKPLEYYNELAETNEAEKRQHKNSHKKPKKEPANKEQKEKEEERIMKLLDPLNSLAKNVAEILKNKQEKEKENTGESL